MKPNGKGGNRCSLEQMSKIRRENHPFCNTGQLQVRAL
jgi:hypothetical protein